MQVKVSDYIAEFLRVQKIDLVFEVAGGMITHLLDSIYRYGNTNIISMHHEQAASFAADAYGRVTGKPGVALATSGPGATNLLTGIASCYFDSSPALFITGQVNTYEQKGTRKIRQLGFQETDIITMAKPIVKKCFHIDDASQVEATMYEAYECAINDRPGPVLIDLPMNIQREQISVGPIHQLQRKNSITKSLAVEINLLQEYLNQATAPLILVGGGVRCANAARALLDFVELAKIPVVTSLLGYDLLPYDHPMRIGFIGTYGNRWANIALGKADLLIVIGSRLDVRQTGADVDSFSKNKTIIHIDCDEGEINNRIKNCISIVADAKDFLNQATQYWTRSSVTYLSWLNELKALQSKFPDTNELNNITGINPNCFMHDLSQFCEHAIGYVADVGNHQMWAAQSLELKPEQVFITSGGMGAMGFALPAAIGLSLACGKKPVVAIIGDGAFQMNIQELQTIVRNGLPIKIIVLNNNCLGMIRQFQDSYFSGRYQSTYWGYNAPSFSAIAKAYGIKAQTISKPEETFLASEWLWEKVNEPVLLEVLINPHTNVYPKIAFGKPISEMEPFALPIGIEST
ncbi:thiamine pyrophosphate-binding protein [Legionella sp. D16C41]|uniref:thiamine pyrophosphate-binding protein n=1 Tax=Legionella sp. D16C41 TaxID=3402688 RepID=UPI003AF653FE